MGLAVFLTEGYDWWGNNKMVTVHISMGDHPILALCGEEEGHPLKVMAVPMPYICPRCLKVLKDHMKAVDEDEAVA